MTDYQLIRRSVEIFKNYHVPLYVRKRYQRDWVRSVKLLGDKWFYAKYVDRLTPDQQQARADDGTYKLKGDARG